MDFSKTRKSPILLQEISRKYALDPLRPIRGFVKLENNADKGLVTVIVENVKIFPAGEYCYKLLLAGIKKEQQVYHLLGSIVRRSRRGDLSHQAGGSEWSQQLSLGVRHNDRRGSLCHEPQGIPTPGTAGKIPDRLSRRSAPDCRPEGL